MRRWGLFLDAAVPNLILALAAVLAVRRAPFGPYLAGAVFAALVLSYPALLSAAAVVFLLVALTMYFIAPRLAWRERVVLPLFIVIGTILLYLLTGSGFFLVREPFRAASELVFTLIASAVFTLITNNTNLSRTTRTV